MLHLVGFSVRTTDQTVSANFCYCGEVGSVSWCTKTLFLNLCGNEQLLLRFSYMFQLLHNSGM
jgi:hypothetical protein